MTSHNPHRLAGRAAAAFLALLAIAHASPCFAQTVWSSGRRGHALVNDGLASRSVLLGGEVRKVKTYGQLVTAIIDPSHTLARGYAKEKIADGEKSKMANFNDQMTVQQLIDLVGFLQAQYRIQRNDDLYYPYM